MKYIYIYKLDFLTLLFLFLTKKTKGGLIKYITSSIVGNILKYFLSLSGRVQFEIFAHIDKDGNYRDQMYKDDQGQFLSYSIFEETDLIVKQIQNDILSHVDLHRIFNKPVPKIWLERFFALEMYWDIFWQVFIMAIIKQNSVKVIPDKGISSYIFLSSNSPLFKYFSQSRYYENDSTIIFGRRLAWLISLSNFVHIFLLYITFTIFCSIRSMFSFSLTKRLVLDKSRIAVEYVWGHDVNSMSDLYWYKNIDLSSNRLLFYFRRKDKPLTIEIANILNDKGINFVNLKRSRQIINNSQWGPGGNKYVCDIKAATKLYLVMLNNLYYLNDNSIAWYITKGIKLIYLVNYWKDFFNYFNTRINMSHSGDAGSGHVIQSLAMHLNDGINVRSNYSYTSTTSLFHAREFHVYFRWGEQMGCGKKEQLYNHVNVISGYPFDYLFVNNQSNNETILQNNYNKIQNKYTISIFDTTISNEYREQFYQSFIKLALDNDFNVVLKPKKQYEFRNHLLLGFKEALQKGRLTLMDKNLMPYQASMNANISVCLGINSAGIEVALAGGRCLYWVPDAYRCSQLENEAGSKLIFHDLHELLELLKDIASGKKNLEQIGDHSKFINQIDSWRDHNAGERVGRFIQSYLNTMDKTSEGTKSLETAMQSYAEVWGRENVEKCTLV